jgi:fibronectin-binding autotransporter adhesin
MKKIFSGPRSLLLAAGSLLLAISSARAADSTWQGPGTDLNTAGNWTSGLPTNSGDTATWDGTAAGNLGLTWSATFGSTPNGTNLNITGTQTGNLLLGGTSGTLAVGNITIASGAGAFTLGDGVGLDDTVFRNPGGATTNTFTNNSSNTATFAANVIYNSGGAAAGRSLVFAGSGNWAVNGNLVQAGGGSFTVTKTGTGTLTLSGPNSYTGTTTISSGILAISNNTALGTTAGITTIAATGLSTGPQLSLSGGITSAENITLTGNSEQNQYNSVINNTSGTNTLSGNITLASPAGGIRLGSGGGELIFSGTISQTGTTRSLTLQASNGAALTVNNAIANNNGQLFVINTGAVTLKGASTAIGATTIAEGGNLKLGVTNAIKTDQTLTIGAAYNFTGSDQGTFDLAGFNQTVNSLVGTKNTSNVGADSTRIVTNSATGTSTLTVGNGNGTGIFNGVIQDGGAGKIVALTKTGTGTLTLVGNSNYSGVTTISGGAIAITHANALGSTAGNTTIAATGASNGARLLISGTINSPENITLTGTTEVTGFEGAIINTANANTLSGNITLAGTGGLKIKASGGTLNLTGNITQTGTSHHLVLQPQAGTAVINVSNPIAINGGELLLVGLNSGDGALVTLNGASGSGIGATTLAQRVTLRLGVSDALNTTANLTLSYGGTNTGEDRAILDLRGFNQTVNALLGNAGTGASPSANSFRLITNGAASGTSILTVGNGGGSGTFRGQINNGATASIQLIKAGAGNQTLSDTNSYTGGTRIDNGTLTLGHATNTLANTGTINVNGGTLAIGANSDTVGAVTLTSGSITGSTGVLTGSSYGVQSGSVSAILGGSGVALSKSTSGTVTLSAVNTYSGSTTISAGTLEIQGSIASSSGITNNAALVFNSGSAQSYGNAIVGSGLLTKQGAGTLTLSGANSYTGVTTITGGTLNAATLAAGGSNSAIGAAAVAAGNLIINGGTLRYDANTAAQSTNRLFTLGTGGATFDSSSASSANTMSFTATGAVGTTGSGSRLLTLTGSNTGNNTMTPVIGDGPGGATSLVKSGSGTWVLAGASSYTGTTAVNAGTLSLTGSLTGGGAVSTSGTGVLNQSSTGVISGASTLTQGSSGTSILSGANTFTGATLITGGTLSVESIAATGVPQPLGAGSTPIQLQGGTLAITGTDPLGYTTTRGLQLVSPGNESGTLSVAGTVNMSGGITGGSSGATFTKAGTGTFNYSGSATWNGNFNISGGTFNLTGGGSIAGVGVTTVQSSSTLKISTTGEMKAASLDIVSGGTVNLEVGTLRVGGGGLTSNTRSIDKAGDSFNWGNGTLAVYTAGSGESGVTDRTGIGGAASGPVVKEGNYLSVAGNLTNASGSTLDLGSTYLSGGLRYNQLNVEGTLTLDGGTLNIGLNPYFLRPTSPNSMASGDWGTLVLVYAGDITGFFAQISGKTVIPGIGQDAIGWTQLPDQVNTGLDPASLLVNEWVIEYRDGVGGFTQSGGDAILLHYKVAGAVPEPASAGLLIVGGILLGALRRHTPRV